MQCLHPIDVKNPRTGRYIQVRCRKCPSCFNARKRDWAIRLLMEAKYSKNLSYFVTLTFDDMLISDKPFLSSELDKKFLSDFIKRLRRRLEYHGIDKDLRYFACGEYGDNFDRAHYHAIFFDIPLSRQDFYTFLMDTWKVGFVTVDALTPARCMYVAKYTCKQLFDFPEYEKHKQKPFASMSKRPLLGYQILNDSALISRLRKYGNFCLNSDDGQAYNLPRYFAARVYTPRDREFHAALSSIGNPVFDFYKSGYEKIINDILKKNKNDEYLFYKRLRDKK